MDGKWIFLAGLVCLLNATHGTCPEKCSCTKISENSTNLKVKCRGTPQSKILSLKELNFENDYENVVQLDLSKNQIAEIEEADLSNYTNLKRLDLSFNSIKSIDETMFGQIPSLERLKLSTNLIVHIFQGSFEKLTGLKELDVSANPLACDCNLLWLVAWANNMSVRLKPAPKCETPVDFKGMHLKKLKVGSDLHCESPLQPLLELKPDENQLVFEGDTLVLRCRAPRVAVGAPRDSEDLPARAHVFWGWSEKIIEPNSTEDVVYHDPTLHFPSVQIDAKHLSDSGLLDSILTIPHVTPNHTGMWDCRLRSQQANSSRSISVIVVSNKTKYCDAKVLRNNKGAYFWPKTVRGRLVKLPCSGETATNSFASYKCNTFGHWENLNTEMCPFISETTRILEQFAKVNLSIARGSVNESAKRLRNYTQSAENLSKFRDPIDLVFISKTLKNYLSYSNNEKELMKDLGSMLLDIVSKLMTLPSYLTQGAQRIENSSSNFVYTVEQAAQHIQSSHTHKNNLAIEYFPIRVDQFNGMTCTWFRTDIGHDERIFQCNIVKTSQTVGTPESFVEASMQVPSSLIRPQSPTQFSIQKLMVAVYQNSNFFPNTQNDSQYVVTSPVIGVKLVGKPLNENLTEPISVMLRARPFHHEDSSPIPVWWDSDAQVWTENPCHFSYFLHGLAVFSCKKLGYYGLMQYKKYLNDFADENAGAYFRPSPPAFYVGGFVLFVCAWINIVTYLFNGSSIQMARRQRHSLINTWLAISFLDFAFTVGIYQTEDYKICQVIGILIHYFSLCVILWVCVSVSNMYKRLSKASRIPIDEVPKESLGKKPILGLYLIGWGISLIICGISGAVNMREYASYSYCFLRTGPALSAIFVPSTILISFLLILLICVRCHIRRVDDQNGHLSEGTQATENVDLELLDSTGNGENLHRSERYRSMTLSTPTTSIQEDLEHSNVSQLRGHFIFLFLYVLMWFSAAISVIAPHTDHILYEETTFSIIYAVTASLLGLFILFFYCISRSDVRIQWSAFSCRNICARSCCRRRGITDSKEINTVAYHQNTGTLNSGSRSNSQCSKSRPSSATNHMKPHGELNSVARTDSPSKLLPPGASMNLVMLNRPQFVHNPVIVNHEIPNPEIFYNPNQINVARKFFKKQKRLAKRNNFELQRQIERGDFGDGASDASSTIGSFPKTRGISIFSSGSKVNNTNIHVRDLQPDPAPFVKEPRPQNANPNILSDSCNESDLIVDAERLVLGAEGIRVLSTRSKVNNTELVANIYTNVPETSQPQHETVTMRADDKFRKSSNIGDLLEQDELDLERNDLNSQSDRTSTPLYVNSHVRNIMDEADNTSRSGILESESCDEAASNDQLLVPIRSPIAAMNTVGLPIGSSVGTRESVHLMNISNDENMIDLDRNEAYISEPLEISDRPYTNANSNAISLDKKSKSLINLDVGETYKTKNIFHGFHESQVRSISCNNISQMSDDILGTIANPLPPKGYQEKRLLSSPVLFSPSLCEIDDMHSPQDRKRPIDSTGNVVSCEANLNFDQNSVSLDLFSQSIRRNFSSSPTCESDLNYQNSELSIRSHGVYAPQPDNDLNITLTADDHIYYPYQSSEISDLEDENDYDDYNNCSHDFLLPKDANDMHDSQSSIDELYQQITRRSVNANEPSTSRRHDNSSTIAQANSNNTRTNGDENEFICSNDNDDDSSQCSIISYIEPNEGGRN